MKLEPLCKIIEKLEQQATFGQNIRVELTRHGLLVKGKRHDGLFTVACDRHLAYSMLDDMQDILAERMLIDAIAYVVSAMSKSMMDAQAGPRTSS